MTDIFNKPINIKLSTRDILFNQLNYVTDEDLIDSVIYKLCAYDREIAFERRRAKHEKEKERQQKVFTETSIQK